MIPSKKPSTSSSKKNTKSNSFKASLPAWARIEDQRQADVTEKLALWTGKIARWAPQTMAMLALVMVSLVSVYMVTTQNLETRRQASDGDRPVELLFVPSDENWRAKTLSTLYVRMNTHDQVIDGVQLVMDIRTDVTPAVTLQVKEADGLRWAWEKVEAIENGYRVSLALVSDDPSAGYKNNGAVDIAQIYFEPDKAGDIDIAFVDGWTKAHAHRQQKNVLRFYSGLDFEVLEALPEKPAPSIKPTTSISLPSKGGVGSSSLSATSVTDDRYGAVETVDIAPPVATVILQENFPSLATSSSGVATASSVIASAGSCDSLCTQTSQCSGTLICYQGRCRRTTNPESMVCAEPQDAIISQLCDQSCDTNVECGDSLRCYQGSCRLPNNPTSATCSEDASDVDETVNLLNTSPTPSATPAVVQQQTNSGPSFGTIILRVILTLGILTGVVIMGVVVYVWWQDRQERKL